MRLALSAVVAISGLVLLAAMFGRETAVQAAPVPIDLTATGPEETPPIAETPSAVVHLTWDSTTRIMTYAVTVSGLSPDQVTAAHFHRGAKGIAGPVIYPLSLVGFTQISGQVTFAQSDVADLQAGNFYFNVHSVAHPGGFARAQIPAITVSAPGPAAPAAPAPAALPSTGSGGPVSEPIALVLPLLGLLALTMGAAGVFVFSKPARD
jgi:hypothetical protein